MGHMITLSNVTDTVISTVRKLDGLTLELENFLEQQKLTRNHLFCL